MTHDVHCSPIWDWRRIAFRRWCWGETHNSFPLLGNRCLVYKRNVHYYSNLVAIPQDEWQKGVRACPSLHWQVVRATSNSCRLAYCIGDHKWHGIVWFHSVHFEDYKASKRESMLLLHWCYRRWSPHPDVGWDDHPYHWYASESQKNDALPWVVDLCCVCTLRSFLSRGYHASRGTE